MCGKCSASLKFSPLAMMASCLSSIGPSRWRYVQIEGHTHWRRSSRMSINHTDAKAYRKWKAFLWLSRRQSDHNFLLNMSLRLSPYRFSLVFLPSVCCQLGGVQIKFKLNSDKLSQHIFLLLHASASPVWSHAMAQNENSFSKSPFA